MFAAMFKSRRTNAMVYLNEQKRKEFYRNINGKNRRAGRFIQKTKKQLRRIVSQFHAWFEGETED